MGHTLLWLFATTNTDVVFMQDTVFIWLTALALIKFLDLESGGFFEVGTYSRLALIRFSPFSASEVCLFCNKTINASNKTRRSNKARFLLNTLKKTPSLGKSLIRIYSLKWEGWGWALIWVWLGGGGGGRLLTFSAFRMGGYLKRALIRGWALIRINMVIQ